MAIAKKVAAPAKKVAAKKTAAPARKVAASKPAPVAKKAVAKKVAPAKSTERVVSAADSDATDKQVLELANNIAGVIKQGALDGGFDIIVDAMVERSNDVAQHVATKTRTTAAKTTVTDAKKNTAPPVKRAPKVALKVGSVYAVETGPIKGAHVKFAGYTDANETLSKVVVVKASVGAPKDAKLKIPSGVLKPIPARGRASK